MKQIKIKDSEGKEQIINLPEGTTVEIIEKQEKPSIWDRVEEDEAYYTKDSGGKLLFQTERGSVRDDSQYETHNYCQEKEPLERISKINQLTQAIRIYRDKNDIGVCDWNNKHSDKYHLISRICSENLEVNNSSTFRKLETVYFNNEEVALKASEKFNDRYVELIRG